MRELSARDQSTRMLTSMWQSHSGTQLYSQKQTQKTDPIYMYM